MFRVNLEYKTSIPLINCIKNMIPESYNTLIYKTEIFAKRDKKKIKQNQLHGLQAPNRSLKGAHCSVRTTGLVPQEL